MPPLLMPGCLQMYYVHQTILGYQHIVNQLCYDNKTQFVQK